MLHPSVWGVGILLVCVSRILMHSQDLFLALALSLSLSLTLSLSLSLSSSASINASLYILLQVDKACNRAHVHVPFDLLARSFCSTGLKNDLVDKILEVAPACRLIRRILINSSENGSDCSPLQIKCRFANASSAQNIRG